MNGSVNVPGASAAELAKVRQVAEESASRVDELVSSGAVNDPAYVEEIKQTAAEIAADVEEAGGIAARVEENAAQVSANTAAVEEKAAAVATHAAMVEEKAANVEAQAAQVAEHAAMVEEKVTGGVRIECGTYVGTGTAGIDNPTSLTFDFAPIFVWCGTSQWNMGNSSMSTSSTSSDSSQTYGKIYTGLLTTEYQQGAGFGSGYNSRYGGSAYLSAKKSSDGKTIYWYSTSFDSSGVSTTPSPSYQNNAQGTIYHYVAIG